MLIGIDLDGADVLRRLEDATLTRGEMADALLAHQPQA
ncbi:hypothetical protein SAMN06295981_2508 [Corynebacterium pollutisoli]|uniref:Uncharacterized protein n=1 Tax=Corynebacterium pollutisoli TaxID=1610489 RepID=A0A1X7KF88_9CORY|nr:hypothetical protein SAMN06295981_2508 [Corynebacterium pollutisoli]